LPKVFDYIISALPSHSLADITDNSFTKNTLKSTFKETLKSIEYCNMATLNFGFRSEHKYVGHFLTPSSMI